MDPLGYTAESYRGGDFSVENREENDGREFSKQ